LRDAAIAIVRDHTGNVPRDVTTLLTIPGIGPYTASAILIFAFNTPDTMIETNIRAAFIHAFYQKLHGPTPEKKILDRELLPLITAAADDQDPREWHWALMDYGSYLKKNYPNPSRASAHHVKQTKFVGSLRQVRGAILRDLHTGPRSQRFLAEKSGLPKEQVERALISLERDGLIYKEGRVWRVER
jgi:A/G-specific adenine glycosylase